ncbi:MAG: Uma2 family endonuclease [Spirulinaceae cyanobacterium]
MVQTPIQPKALYPDSDGQPMAENTEQYRWIAKLVTNLKHLLRDQVAFVAGDLLWYPVQVPENQKPPRQAPDVMVVLGRPQQRRGSYKQWEEAGIAPQVVFEIISPSNSITEMLDKQAFYAQYGAQEMYFYDPDTRKFWGLVRHSTSAAAWLTISIETQPWTSPGLGIRFELREAGLAIFYPDGEPFKEPEEGLLERDMARQERDAAQQERDAAQQERDAAQQERDAAQQEWAAAQQERDRLAAKLRELGVDPDGV